MVETPDKITLLGLAGNGWVSRRIQDHLGLLKRRQLMKVAQELKEAHIPWQGGFADPSKHPQIGLQQRKEALRPMLMNIPTGIFLLGVIDKVVHIALERAIAAGRVGIEPTARLHGQVGGLLDRLDREIFGRVDHNGTLTADPRDDRRAVFVIMAPARLALLPTPTWSAPQCLLPALFGLPFVARPVIEVIRFD